jgi:hypothetical protein
MQQKFDRPILLIFFSDMNTRLFYFLLPLMLIGCQGRFSPEGLTTAFEQSNGSETATYEECIAWWKQLEEASPYVCVQSFGQTDAGLPLHVIVVNAGRNFSREKILETKKLRVMINNGIHPGEPDGIDASMLFVRDMLSEEDFINTYDSIVFLIIPIYNVGGALNRNCCSRSNQNGPESYGFRGNARNLDLNRDFIKCDSKNAQSFNQFFTEWNPDIYLETHVSNGADYPYTMTYLASQADKLGQYLGPLVKNTLTPGLYSAMANDDDAMIPYVNVFGNSPDEGYTTFYDSPRYSTGYAALHHSIGLLTETHMLKPFDQRVASTRRFLHHLTATASANRIQIKEARAMALNAALSQTEFALDWKIDSSNITPLVFKGYKAKIDSSQVTGRPQLHYDRNSPWEKTINYFATMTPTKTVTAPHFYLLPAAWSEVVDRMKWNGVELNLFEYDTLIEVNAYKILEINTIQNSFEGHYYHNNTQVEPVSKRLNLLANSYYLIDLNQAKRRFLIETLEPESPDSYFNWNFYDEILQQKEWFSSYVFETEAEELLKDPKIKAEFEQMKASDSSFAINANAQLYFLYQRSEHYERNHHMIYPVFRVE